MTVVDEVRSEVEELERGVRAFFATVDEALRTATTAPVGAPGGPGGPVLVSPELVAAVREGVRRVQETVQPVFDRFGQFLDQRGDPERLREAARGWTAIGTALGDTAGTVGLDRMRANIAWDGSAAEAYRALVPAQADHLTTVGSQCDALATSLDNLADQIDAFWLALQAAAVSMSIAVSLAGVTALTVVGIPAACGAILIAVGGGATLIATAVLALNALSDRIASEQRAMAQSLDDIGATWPAPNTAAMADAGVADGDGSDGRPNR